MTKIDYCVEKLPLKLYRIGMFAQMNRVTVKTLRYYDEVDLLHPESIDEENGYRYYTSNQMPLLHKTLALREIELSIQDIKKVLEGNSRESLLLKKKTELMLEAAEIQKKIACIENYLVGDTTDGEYHVVMKSLPEITVACMRVRLKNYGDLFNKMPDMGLLMEQAGCVCLEPDNCFTMYYEQGYKENDIDAEICEAVTELKEDYGDLKFKLFPKVELAACILHKGPYSTLPKTYQAIVHYMEEIGYEIVGHQREMYIDGIWNKDSEEQWLTEIQFPVRKI